MDEYEYKVLVDGKVYARDMDLDTALTLTKALFDKWYLEPHVAITIEREDNRCTMVMEDTCQAAVDR